MNNKEVKKELDKFFSERYEQMLEIAAIFCRNADDSPSDLVSSTYLSLSQLKNKNGIKNAIEKNNLFNFVFVSLRNGVRGATTEYNKMKIKNRSDLPLSLSTKHNDDYSPSTQEKQWLLITKELHNLYDEKQITEYELKLFQLLHTSEELHDITDLTKKEVDILRKMSLRKLAAKTNISFMAIHNVVFKVSTKLKKVLVEKNIIK